MSAKRGRGGRRDVARAPTSATGPATPPASPPPGSPVGDGVLLGLATALVLGLGELVYVAATSRGGTSAGDLAALAALVLAVLALAGVAAGALGGLVAGAVRGAAARRGADAAGAGRWRARVWTGLAAPAVVAVCALSLSGRRIRALPYRWVLVAGVAAAAVALLYLTLRWRPRVAAWLGRRRSPRSAAALRGAAWLVVAGAAYLADQRVLRGLYAAAHAGAAAITAGATALALWAARDAVPRGPVAARLSSPRARAALAGAVAVAALATALGLGADESSRALVFERTAVTAKLLRVASLGAAEDDGAPPLAATPPSAGAAGAPASAPALPVTYPGVSGPLVKDADVIILSIDALRADHMSLYGYHRRTTPAIDAIARQGTVFRRAYAQMPNTSYSMVSLFTGKYIYGLGQLGLAGGHPTLADLLSRAGYGTAAFYPQVAFFVDSDTFTEYARARLGFAFIGPSASETDLRNALTAEQRVDHVIQYLDRAGPRPQLVWAHFIEPHEPYEQHPGLSFGATARDGYDSEIAYVDRAIGRLVAHINRTRPRALIVITADHGEEFGEHGGRYHGTTLYDEQVHVPLILVGPRIPARTITAPVELVDLPITLLRLVGREPAPRMRGTDLGPWLMAPADREGQMPAAFAEVETKKMVVAGSHKLICDLQHGYCELYDLATDPGEQRNVAAQRPRVVQTLRASLRSFAASHARLEQGSQARLLAESTHEALERGRQGDREAVPGLAALLAGEEFALRAEAAHLLARLPDDPRGHPALRRALRDPLAGPWAAAALARACDPEARQVLAAITLEDPELAGRAGLALAACKEPALPLLAAGLRHPDHLLRERIVTALGRLRDPGATELLFAALRDIPVRPAALRALAESRTREAGPYMEGLVADRNAKVSERQLGVRALAQIKGAAAAPTLERLLAREAEPALLGSVIVELERLGRLRGVVRRSAGTVTAPRGELWVAVPGDARGGLEVLEPAAARARVELRGDAPAYRFAIPRGRVAVRVRGPVTFLYAR